MRVRGFNNVGRAAQTDSKLLRYALAITKQRKCWELLVQKFDRFQSLSNNSQQHATACNKVYKRTQHIYGTCWPRKVRPFAQGFIWQKRRKIGITGLNKQKGLPRDFQPTVCDALGYYEDNSIARRPTTTKKQVKVLPYSTLT